LQFDGEGGWKISTLGQKVMSCLVLITGLSVNTACINYSVVYFLNFQEKDTGILAIEQPKDKLVNGIS